MNRLALHPLEDEVSEPESDCIHHGGAALDAASSTECRRSYRFWDTVSFAYGRHPSRPSARGVDARLSRSVVRTPTHRRVENGLLTRRRMLLRFASKVSFRRCFSPRRNDTMTRSERHLLPCSWHWGLSSS
jgi:hypothetical protein